MNLKNVKSNQIILFVVALMLVSAGYLSYRVRETPVSSNIISENEVSSIGDAKLVSNNNVISSNTLNEIAVETNTKPKTDDYFASSRLGRDTMYSQMVESYQSLLYNQNVGEQQKTVATQEITKINNMQNSIMICENLIKTKGIDDVVIFVNDKSINVIVKSDKLEQDAIAQVQNIIAREMNAEIENIHISNK